LRMDLSIVIVNYNVKFFLEQCLHSVLKASEKINTEIFVVDNNSSDGSVAMLRKRFPEIILIENKSNVGFSVANNQALSISRGRYCLVLNPDTLVEEDTFIKCIHFMDAHPEAGALGVKMIDGKGVFLPESKRALPTPDVAFFKIFGLSRLFPHSKLFGKYHLGFLDKNKTHIVSVLAGAFMFIRKEALDKTGLLDENFFMYGEDIDLSYRLTKAGFVNYYFAGTTIIHYKGESTKKGSINYVIVFYKAMIIFAKKHFSQKNARIFSFLIHSAIYFRAFLSVFKRFLDRIFQPAIDAILIFAGYFFITNLLEQIKYDASDYFPENFYKIIIPAYVLIWLISIYLSGGYIKPIRIWNLLKGYLLGFIIILIMYALLPENFRYSRLIILLGAIWTPLALAGHRLLFSLMKWKGYELSISRQNRIIIMGKEEESLKVLALMREIESNVEFLGFISEQEGSIDSYIGKPEKLREAIIINKANEIIFCSSDIPSREIIKHISNLSDLPIDFKIASAGTYAIIGSNSVKAPGDLFLLPFSSIGTKMNRRRKRIFDLISSFIIIAGFPLFIFIFPLYSKKLLYSMKVLFGNYTWIGYETIDDLNALPEIKRGIYTISCCDSTNEDHNHANILNIKYARDYTIQKDLALLWKNLISKK
jgi:O-antigen biosynthesis protein